MHHRIRQGSLAARKIGNQWVIEEAELRRVARLNEPGRPLSATSAWDLLAVALGGPASAALTPVARSRARSRLRVLVARAAEVELDRVPALLGHVLRNRAERMTYAASPLDLDDLCADERVHLSGVAIPESNMAAGAFVESYVCGDDLAGLVKDYLLSSSRRDAANVVLHTVPSAQARPDIGLDEVARSPLALAADLAEHDGVREWNEAVRCVATLRPDHDEPDNDEPSHD